MENEAFDRYMQNISLLEEAFSVKSAPEGTTDHGVSVSYASPNLEDDSRVMVDRGKPANTITNCITEQKGSAIKFPFTCKNL